jgi:hypothetical protein
MKRFLLLIIAAALPGLLFFVFHKAPPTAVTGPVGEPVRTGTPPAPGPSAGVAAADPKSVPPSSQSSGDTGELIDSRDILALARAYRVNLVDSLNQIRSQCLPDWSREECHQRTRDYLRDRVETRDMDALLALYDRYLQYEDFLAASQPVEGVDLKGMAHLLDRARGMYFDEQTRGWLFGAEDARLGWEIVRQEFLADPPEDLSPSQRVEAYESLRKKHLGRYAALFAIKENPLEDIDAKLMLLAPGGEVREEDSTLHQALLQQRQRAAGQGEP